MIRTSREARVYICQEKAQYFQIASTWSFIFTSYRTILNLLGLGKWPVCLIVNSAVKTIFQNLIRRFICLMCNDKVSDRSARDDTLLGYVQFYKGCFCSWWVSQDKSPCPEEYVNSKEYQSIVLQGLANTKNLFRNVFAGWFWQSNDAIVSIKSRMFRRIFFVSDITA